MKHIVFVSGGLSSFAALYGAVKKYGKYNTIPLFTDTLIEDPDLYRFLLETINILYRPHQTGFNDYFVKRLQIPDYSEIEKRKEYLETIRQKIASIIPQFIWLSKKMTPFDIFIKDKFMGNSRIDPCSAKLKREVSNKWIKENFKTDECLIYLGFDQDEPNRIDGAKRNWQPYNLTFPVAETPWIYEEAMNFLQSNNIQKPVLYSKGFVHNNCGGFCVKQGQKGYKNLLEQYPERFSIFAEMEEKVYTEIGKKHPFLKKQINGETQFLTLKEFKQLQEKETILGDSVDLEDSSCSCFV